MSSRRAIPVPRQFTDAAPWAKADYVYAMWRERPVTTIGIAWRLGITEAQAYNLLHEGRERARKRA